MYLFKESVEEAGEAADKMRPAIALGAAVTATVVGKNAKSPAVKKMANIAAVGSVAVAGISVLKSKGDKDSVFEYGW